MAEIVVGIGVPHTPYLPRMVRDDPGARIVELFSRARVELEAARPDVMVVFTSDHFVEFFYDKLPAFTIGTADKAEGPFELSREMPWYTTPIAGEFGKGLLAYGLTQQFDLAGSEEFQLDHATLVPLHFLTPDMGIPIVPVFVNGLGPPLPTATRCFELGRMIGRYVAGRPEGERVAVVASGSFSLEVGGPTMGKIDEQWVDDVVEMLRHDQREELAAATTTERLSTVGNTGGEILNWIAMMGMLPPGAPTFLEKNIEPPDSPRDAHAIGIWR